MESASRALQQRWIIIIIHSPHMLPFSLDSHFPTAKHNNGYIANDNHVVDLKKEKKKKGLTASHCIVQHLIQSQVNTDIVAWCFALEDIAVV